MNCEQPSMMNSILPNYSSIDVQAYSHNYVLMISCKQLGSKILAGCHNLTKSYSNQRENYCNTQSAASMCSAHRLKRASMHETNHSIAKFTDEQYATINQSTAGRFDPRVFVNCLQVSTCKQLTKTLGPKRPAVD